MDTGAVRLHRQQRQHIADEEEVWAHRGHRGALRPEGSAGKRGRDPRNVYLVWNSKNSKKDVLGLMPGRLFARMRGCMYQRRRNQTWREESGKTKAQPRRGPALV